MSLPDPKKLIQKMANELNTSLGHHKGDHVIIGIHTGGAWVAESLYHAMKTTTPIGSLDISFYRDDFTQLGLHPKVKSSNLPDIEGKTVILVDDVVMSGRTIRAAMNELFDFGRPNRVLLACLLDVGQRELPIQPDSFGAEISLPKGQRIKLCGPNPMTLKIVNLEPTGIDA